MIKIILNNMENLSIMAKLVNYRNFCENGKFKKTRRVSSKNRC